MEQARYWFNVRTGQVETDEDKSQSKELMGPYRTRAEAAGALAAAAERTHEWDEQDRRWREIEDED